MDYSLRELECFVAAAEERSFTAAARRLHLAQPPLSRHIRGLEETLGARLFERRRQGVALTPAGAAFYEETQAVLPQLQRAAATVRRVAAGETRRLRIGFVSAVLGPELVEVLAGYRRRHPEVRLGVEDRLPADQLEAIAAGRLDGGFVGLAPERPVAGVQMVRWRRERLACFVPAGDAWVGRTEVALKELAGRPLVAVASEAAPAFGAFVRECCRRAGFRPRVVAESPRAQAVAVLVAAGEGVALLPESLARVVGAAAVVVPLARAPQVTHVFARRAGPMEAAMRGFVQALTRGT